MWDFVTKFRVIVVERLSCCNNIIMIAGRRKVNVTLSIVCGGSVYLWKLKLQDRALKYCVNKPNYRRVRTDRSYQAPIHWQSNDRTNGFCWKSKHCCIAACLINENRNMRQGDKNNWVLYLRLYILCKCKHFMQANVRSFNDISDSEIATIGSPTALPRAAETFCRIPIKLKLERAVQSAKWHYNNTIINNCNLPNASNVLFAYTNTNYILILYDVVQCNEAGHTYVFRIRLLCCCT